MHEFLLRRVDDDWMDCPTGPEASLWFAPNGIGAETAQGFGNYAMKIGSAVIRFSDEGGFIQVVFEGTDISEEWAFQVMEKIREQYQSQAHVPIQFTAI